MNTETHPDPSHIAAELDWLELVWAKVKDLRYGVVQLVVHDGHVTQIERTEKTRLASRRGCAPDR